MYDEFVMCRYCRYATTLSHSQTQMLCEKHGIVDVAGKCRKFELDLLAIQPPAKKRDLADKKGRFNAADFSIE